MTSIEPVHLALINIIQIISVFQAAFGAVLIWQNQRYRGLAYLLLLVAVSMVFNLLEETAGSRQIYLVTPIFQLGKGPFFFFFVYYLVYRQRPAKRKLIWHSLPMFLALPLTHWPQFVIGAGTISQLIYAYLSLRLIYKYHKASFSNSADAESSQLNWVVYVLASFLILGLLDLVRLNLQPYIPISVNLGGQLLENTSSLILYSFLIYKAVQHPHLFDGLANFELVQQQPIELDDGNEENYLRPIYESLEELIRKHSLHHKPRLSLNDLADETGLNSRDISRSINVIGGLSFCDYINRLRIADVKQKLTEQNDRKQNLLEVAFGYGFNSKSSFNGVFKRELGMTPSQFIRSLDS